MMLFNEISSLSDTQIILKLHDPEKTKQEICDAIERTDLPEDYISVLQRAEKLEIIGETDFVRFFSLKDAKLINDDPAYMSYLPHLYFFGNDNGGQLYAFDPGDEWGNGKAAMYMIPMGSLYKDDSRILGTTLSEVIKKLNDNIRFRLQPKLS